ncbi:MAG: hypothetical protein AAFX99_02920 [Myxococcota bacterium]
MSSPLYERVRETFGPAFIEYMHHMFAEAEIPDWWQTRLENELEIRINSILKLAEVIAVVDDDEELYNALVCTWLELRMAWVSSNLVNNYQMVLVGQLRPQYPLRSAMLSTLMAEVEHFIMEDDRNHLLLLAATPLVRNLYNSRKAG